MALALYPWQESLANELNRLRNALPNGVLVHGPRGIGTFELVLHFARSLLCEQPQADGSPCGGCHACQMTKAFTHPDIRYLVSEAEALPREIPFEPPEGASSERKSLYREILIHQPRALAEFLTLKSHQGGVRVVVVYPADQIRAEAAASLLKSLEEPPENTVFLMVADEIDAVLPTIRSRCRLIRAQAPSFEASLAWLQSQGVALAQEKLIESGGRPLAAIEETDTRRVLEASDKDKLIAFLCEGPSQTGKIVVESVSKEVSLPAAALLFSRWSWDLAAVQMGQLPRYFPQYASQMQLLIQRTTPNKLYPWINSVRDVRRVEDHPLASKLMIEQLLLAYQRVFR